MRKILGWGISIVGLAIAVFAILPRSLEPIQRGRRSVLLITLDTTRADHLGAYGADDVETPNLDRIAEHGTTMENAFAVSPITLPAHASIMTGLYPFQTGVRNNGTHRVPARLTTLVRRFVQATTSVLEKRRATRGSEYVFSLSVSPDTKTTRSTPAASRDLAIPSARRKGPLA